MEAWHEVLQVNPYQVNLMLLKKQRNQLAKIYHPDGSKPNPAMMVKINRAYEAGKIFIKEQDYQRRQTVNMAGGTYVYNETLRRTQIYLRQKQEEAERKRKAEEEKWANKIYALGRLLKNLAMVLLILGLIASIIQGLRS